MSPSRLRNAVRLMLLVQHRSGFLQIYFGVTFATILIVRLFLPESWWSMVVPALLLGEYGTMGVFMVAAMRFFERQEGSTAALVVTPLRSWEHVLAMILAPSAVAVVAGLAVFAGIFGVDGRLLFLFMPLFLTTVLAGFDRPHRVVPLRRVHAFLARCHPRRHGLLVAVSFLLRLDPSLYLRLASMGRRALLIRERGGGMSSARGFTSC